MKQLIDFDPAKGGTEPGMCLKNVRLGFSIAPRYNDAWHAWNNSTQFKNKDFPRGVDIPLYYDYTDSKGNRYGHINVRMADGGIWNDGDMYASLSDFEGLHSNVKYVGWSDTVNNVKVIKEADMPTKTQVRDFFRKYLQKEPTTTQLVSYSSKSWSLLGIDAAKTLNARINTLKNHVANRDTAIKQQQAEIKDLQAKLSVQSQDTENLNKLGETLVWLLTRLGVK